MNPKAKPIRFWSLDLEMEQPSNEILSIGMAVQTNSGIHSNNFYITPTEPVSEYIRNLTGIVEDNFDRSTTREQCFKKALDWLIECFKGEDDELYREPIVWGSGDLALLRGQSPAFAEKISRRSWDVKTLLLYQKYVSGKSILSSMSLSSAAKSAGINVTIKHNSEADAFNTLLLFLKMRDNSVKVNALIHELKEMK